MQVLIELCCRVLSFYLGKISGFGLYVVRGRNVDMEANEKDKEELRCAELSLGTTTTDMDTRCESLHFT